MKTLALIPARGGSKGIPRKNLAILAGKPLLQYSVEAARGCGMIDRIFLSSDDPEILALGRLLGIDDDYRRPDDLSGDRAVVIDAVLHGLDWLEARGECFDAVILLQPTSPLRTGGDITAAMDCFMAGGGQSLVSVHRLREHPFECIRGESGNWSWLAEPDGVAAGRQDYAGKFFFVNGAIYITRTEFLRRQRKFVESGKALLYEMPPERGIDIDEPAQFQLADWLMRMGGESC